MCQKLTIPSWKAMTMREGKRMISNLPERTMKANRQKIILHALFNVKLNFRQEKILRLSNLIKRSYADQSMMEVRCWISENSPTFRAPICVNLISGFVSIETWTWKASFRPTHPHKLLCSKEKHIPSIEMNGKSFSNINQTSPSKKLNFSGSLAMNLLSCSSFPSFSWKYFHVFATQ